VGRRHFRQCEPLCQFRRKRCAVKLSLGNVTAAHSPKNLGAVRVFFYSSSVEALDRDIEVQPTNLQIRVLLNHTTPVMARPANIAQRRCAYRTQIANLKSGCPGNRGVAHTAASGTPRPAAITSPASPLHSAWQTPPSPSPTYRPSLDWATGLASPDLPPGSVARTTSTSVSRGSFLDRCGLRSCHRPRHSHRRPIA